MTLRRFLRLAAIVLFGVCATAHAQQNTDASSVGSAASASISAAAPTDRQLAANVRHALRAARKQGLKSTYVRVRARDGVITLSGVVASESQIALASQVAQTVSGVRTVQSKLEVRTNVNGLSGSQ